MRCLSGRREVAEEKHSSMVLYPGWWNLLPEGSPFFWRRISRRLFPYLLAFAAGAMIYVVVEELVPESAQGSHSNIGTIGFALGFALMMILDVALG